jgi:hypothetical protein
MDRKDIDWRRVNPILEEYIDPICKSKLHINYVKFEENCTALHELRKAEECFNGYVNRQIFLTNPKLKNGKKPDIMFIPLENYNPYFLEIQKSESDKSILTKKDCYGLYVEVVRCTQ